MQLADSLVLAILVRKAADNRCQVSFADSVVHHLGDIADPVGDHNDIHLRPFDPILGGQYSKRSILAAAMLSANSACSPT